MSLTSCSARFFPSTALRKEKPPSSMINNPRNAARVAFLLLRTGSIPPTKESNHCKVGPLRDQTITNSTHHQGTSPTFKQNCQHEVYLLPRLYPAPRHLRFRRARTSRRRSCKPKRSLLLPMPSRWERLLCLPKPRRPQSLWMTSSSGLPTLALRYTAAIRWCSMRRVR